MKYASRLALASLLVQSFCNMYGIWVDLNDGFKIRIGLDDALA